MPYSRPGTYVVENNLPNIASFGARVTSAAIIGTAVRGPTTPTRVESWSQYQSLFGGFEGGHDLPYSVFTFFSNGGRVAFVTRAVGTGAAASDLEVSGDYGAGPTTATIITFAAANPGLWGDDISVAVTEIATRTSRFTVTVKYQDVEVESWSDLGMLLSDTRYIETVINSLTTGSTYITATVNPTVETALTGGAALDVAAVADTNLAGGATGSAPASGDWATAVTAQASVEGPFLLNLVGQSDSTIVNNAISFAAGRSDVFVIVDPDAAASANHAVGSIPSYTQSSYCSVYFPRLIFVDPSSTSSGGTRITYPGGALCGLFVRTDAERGVFKAPAGQASVIGGALALEYRPTDTEYGTLNDNHIDAFRAIPGTGVVAWGARTLKRDTIDQYIPARRSLIFLTQALKDATAFAVFEPNDERLWNSVGERARRIVDSFWRQGGLKGLNPQAAYYIVCDSTNNTPSSVGAGEVHLEVGVALQAPAEFVIIRLGQWTGGTSTEELL